MDREARQMPKTMLRAASRVQNEPDVPPARSPQPLDITQGGFEPSSALGVPRWIPATRISQGALISTSAGKSSDGATRSSPSGSQAGSLNQTTLEALGTQRGDPMPTRNVGPAALTSFFTRPAPTSLAPTISRSTKRPLNINPPASQEARHSTVPPANTVTIPPKAPPHSAFFKLFVHPSQLLAANPSPNTGGTIPRSEGKKAGRTCTVCGRESCKGRGGYKYCPYPCRDCGGPGTVCQGRDVKAGKKLCSVATQRLREQRQSEGGSPSEEDRNESGAAGHQDH